MDPPTEQEFRDWKLDKQLFAIYQLLLETRKAIANQLTDEQRMAITEAHAKAKELSDQSQAALRKLITPE